MGTRRRRLFIVAAAAGALTAAPAVPTSANGDIVPPAGTDPATIDVKRVKGAYELPTGGVAVPVRAARPSWLTDAHLEAAAKGPTPAPAAAPTPFDYPATGYAGIGPGSEMVFPYGCTMNFIFGSPGSYSIGTAGHCVDKVGEPVTLLTVAPGGSAGTGWVLVQVGNVQKRVENGIGADFALVSIKSQYQSWVRSTIPQVLGPCGKYTGGGVTQSIAHYGHGIGIGTGGTARVGHALYWEPKAFWWAGTVIFGDSGSAARTGTGNLNAAGDVTHLVVHTRHLGATAAGTRAAELERIAGKPIVNSNYCL